MRNFILLFVVSMSKACPKSCSKELCNSVTAVARASCYAGSVTTGLIPARGSAIKEEIGLGILGGLGLSGLGCTFEDAKINYGGCAAANGCSQGNQEDLNKALEGLKN